MATLANLSGWDGDGLWFEAEEGDVSNWFEEQIIPDGYFLLSTLSKTEYFRVRQAILRNCIAATRHGVKHEWLVERASYDRYYQNGRHHVRTDRKER